MTSIKNNKKFEIARKISPEKLTISHQHDFFELFYFLGNEMHCFIKNQSFTIKKYDMVLIDKYTYHKTKYFPVSSTERIIVMLDESIINLIDDYSIKAKILNLFKLKKVSFSEDFNVYLLDAFFNRLLPSYSKSNSPVNLIKSQYILLEILLSIVEIHQNNNLLLGNNMQTHQERRITDVINFINLHYAESFNLDFLCEHFFVNKYYLCHMFKDITGISITDYLNTKRLTEAEKLLKNTDLNITTVASSVGFNSVSYFISLFKKKYNVTPKQLKEAYKSNSSCF